jgi:hypothetical protein
VFDAAKMTAVLGGRDPNRHTAHGINLLIFVSGAARVGAGARF